MGVRWKAVAALCGLTFALVVGVASAGALPSARTVDCTGTAALTTSTGSAVQGQLVTVNGACFTPNSNVTVTFADGSLQASVGTAATDASGSFTTPLNFTIPANATPNTGAGVFTGDDGTLSPATVAIDIAGCKSDSPVLTVSPSSTPVLGAVDVAGNCFAASDTITLSLTGGTGAAGPAITTTPAAITSDGSGAFTASFTVPFTTVTGDSGKVTGTDGHDGEASADLAITACTPGLSVDPATTAPGTNVTVTGSCFTPSKTVTLTFKDSANATTDVSPATKPTVGDDGSFTALITVPATAAAGSATVTGADDAAPPATAFAALVVVPADTSTTTPAGCDTSTSSSSTTSTTAASTTTTAAATTTTAASTTTTTAAAGARAFADEASTTSTSITYNATMAASPSTVAAGGTTTVTGSGFTPCAEVTLTLHSDPVALGTATADATGAFSQQVTIPASTTAGTHTITGAAGGTNGIATITVTAEGTSTSAGSGSSSSTAAVTPAQSGGPLAFTGAHAALYSGLGLLLVLAGGTVAFLARRRRLENARWTEL
jgi:hypothetical protein